MNGQTQAAISLGMATTLMLLGCDQSAKQPLPKTEPAQVSHHVEENDLNRITLTEQAEQRLGIQLADNAD